MSQGVDDDDDVDDEDVEDADEYPQTRHHRVTISYNLGD